MDQGVRDTAHLRALAVFGHPGVGVTELCNAVSWDQGQWPGPGWMGPDYEWIWVDV